MSNATATVETVKSNAAPAALTIKGQPYGATTYTPEADGYSNGVRLEKRDGTTYDVVDGPHGAECDCPDWHCRHDSFQTAGCKHVRACRDAGLIQSPDPTVRQIDNRIDNLPDAIAYLERVGPVVEAVAKHFGSNAEAPTSAPAPTVERKPDLRTVHGATIDMDLWLNGPRPAAAPAPCCPGDEPTPCAACVAEADDLPAHLVEGEGDGRRDDAGEDIAAADPIDDAGEEDADDFGPAAGWPAWTDGGVWNLGPAPAPAAGEPAPATFTLDAWIDHEADRYRALGTGAGRLVADTLATLARSVRFVSASTPDTFLARTAALDAGRWEDQGEADARD